MVNYSNRHKLIKSGTTPPTSNIYNGQIYIDTNDGVNSDGAAILYDNGLWSLPDAANKNKIPTNINANTQRLEWNDTVSVLRMFTNVGDTYWLWWPLITGYASNFSGGWNPGYTGAKLDVTYYFENGWLNHPTINEGTALFTGQYTAPSITSFDFGSLPSQNIWAKIVARSDSTLPAQWGFKVTHTESGGGGR